MVGEGLPIKPIVRMKIHVIDDAGLISSHLLMTESDVEFFNDEIQALNAVEQRQPDLVLLNYSVRDQHTPEYEIGRAHV